LKGSNGDPVSFGATLKALNESIGAVWKNRALLLWCLATVCEVVLAALFVAAHFNFGNAPDLFKDYSVYIGIAFLTLIVFACFRTYDERPKPLFSFVPNYRPSFVHYRNQGDGQTFTQLALRFQVTNLTDYDMKLSSVRLLRPRVRRAAIVADSLLTQHPEEYIYSSEAPILKRSLTHCGVNFMINHQIGRAGKPLRVVIELQDHTGRWHKVVFEHLSSRI
jgi:hypothetical protein